PPAARPRRLPYRAWPVARGTPVSGPAPAPAPLDEDRLARATLTYLAEPGDLVLGALLAVREPAAVLAMIKADTVKADLVKADRGTGDPVKADTGPGFIGPTSRAVLERALGRWRMRLPKRPADDEIAAGRRDGIRLVCPQDAEWPSAVDQLGPARP